MSTTYAIILVLGYVLAVVFAWRCYSIKHKVDGYIRINTHDPEKDVYTLELWIPFGELDLRKNVVFKVSKDE